MRMRERGRPLAARIWSIIIFSDALHQAVLLFIQKCVVFQSVVSERGKLATEM